MKGKEPIDFIIRQPRVQILGLRTWSGNLTSLTLSFLITPILQGMMGNQWDNICKAPTTVPSNLLSTNTHSPPPVHPEGSSSLCAWDLGFLPSSPLPPSSMDAQTLNLGCVVEDSPSITQAWLLSQSLSTLTILINLLLSGFTFISSRCYALFSRREFMLTSGIHLPTSTVNSHRGKELIFVNECLLFLVNKLYRASLGGPATPSFANLLEMDLKTGFFTSVPTVVFLSSHLGIPLSVCLCLLKSL